MSSKKRTLSECFKNNLFGIDAYTRHKKLIRNYMQYYGAKLPSSIPSEYKTERDIVQKNHKFVHEDNENELTWEQRVAKKYYDKLFKEYAICELKYYKEGKIALRWRVEKEVVSGKGQFICASTRCESSLELKSWEVNFGYMENGEKKNELVKVRLCSDCSHKLNYKTKMRLARTLKSKEKRHKRIKSTKSSSEEESSSSEESSDSSDQEDAEQKEENEKEKAEKSIWSKPLEEKEEKTKEEEYEDYFADLLQ